MRQKIIKVHPVQHDFLTCADRYSVYIGGRGAGKTFAGALKAGIEAQKGTTGLVIAPTYTMLKDSTFATIVKVLGETIADYNRSDMRITLRNGSIILGRSADNPDRLRGLNAAWLWMDEARDMTRDTWLIAIATLREGSGRAWITTTPHGFDWIYDTFVTGNAGAIFRARMADNPYLPKEFVENMQREYGDSGAFAAQELSGEFVTLGGGLFDVSKIEVVEQSPAVTSATRFYDLAITEKSTSDYTAGVLLGITADDRYVIQHVLRFKASLPDVLETMARQAAFDGPQVGIKLEAEKAGIIGLDYLMRDPRMAVYRIGAETPIGDKYTRAAPFASRVNAGRVQMVRGEWNRAFLDELAAFPDVQHDDQVDALSGAYHSLATYGLPISFGDNKPAPRLKEIDLFNLDPLQFGGSN